MVTMLTVTTNFYFVLDDNSEPTRGNHVTWINHTWYSTPRPLSLLSISGPIIFLTLCFFSTVKPSHYLPVFQSLLNKCNGSWPSCNKIWINSFSTGLGGICVLSQSKNKNTFIITFKQFPLKSRAKQEQSFPHLIQHITVGTKHYINSKKNKGNNDLIRGLNFSLFSNAWLLMQIKLKNLLKSY